MLAVASFGQDNSAIPSPAGRPGGRISGSSPFRDLTAARFYRKVVSTRWSIRSQALSQAKAPYRRLS
jgi:hypothetical protein